ncbi:MAG: hypothetical protein M0P33_03935 [Massilibacteroides sp.]|nr:hypothetical protein [Massilibacteroides sp.]
MLLVQNGLTDRIAGSAGNVCKGLIVEKEYEWDIEYYVRIDTTCELPRPKGRGFLLHGQYLHHREVM